MKNNSTELKATLAELKKIESFKTKSEKELIEIARSLQQFSEIIYELYSDKFREK
jgi:hypothetical protein